jgi:hypothetical protein
VAIPLYCLFSEVVAVLVLEEAVCFLFGETDELGFVERDLVRVELEQGFAGAILEGRDDFGHGVKHSFGHWSWHGGDDGAGDFHFVVWGWLLLWEMERDCH